MRGCGLAFAALVLLWVGSTDMVPASAPPNNVYVTGPQPDPRRANKAGVSPTEADLDRLRSLEGKPQEIVLRTLGHPVGVARRADGTEIWRYPWQAVCEVFIKGGTCIGTFYTGGY